MAQDFDSFEETEDRSLTPTEIVINFFRAKWKIIVPVVLVIALAITFFNIKSSKDAQANVDKVLSEAAASSTENAESEHPDGVDVILMNQQPSLIEKYGQPKAGFIWDVDGTLLSLGEVDWEADKVVYTYLRALNTLDFATVERMSRRSSVAKTYGEFFDRSTSQSIDYREQFYRNMYRQSLLSMQVQDIQRSANFSKNKQVYTVNAVMLDLGDKEFWRPDEQMIFDNLRTFTKSEEDNAKASMFLYDYVTSKYEKTVAALNSNETVENPVKMRQVQFDLTVERYPAQNSGWLVSIDKDLDLLAKYSEGMNVVDYIKSQYREYATNRQNQEVKELSDQRASEAAEARREAREEAIRRRNEEAGIAPPAPAPEQP